MMLDAHDEEPAQVGLPRQPRETGGQREDPLDRAGERLTQPGGEEEWSRMPHLPSSRTTTHGSQWVLPAAISLRAALAAPSGGQR